MKGKNIALIFEKPSTRTRCAFEVAAHDLGICTTYLAEGSQIGDKESIADTARVLGRMYEGIEYRGFEHSNVEELAICRRSRLEWLANEFIRHKCLQICLQSGKFWNTKRIKTRLFW